MGRSKGAKELEGGQLGRNLTAAFLKEGCLKRKGGRKDIPETWILLKCYWVNLYLIPSNLITTPPRNTHTQSFEMNRRFVFMEGKYRVIPQRFSLSDFCVSINLISSKPGLKRRKALELARKNSRSFS